MAQEVGYLPRREGFDAAVQPLYSIDQDGGKSVSQGVQALALQSSGFQDAVVPFAEVYWAGVAAVLVWNQR